MNASENRVRSSGSSAPRGDVLVREAEPEIVDAGEASVGPADLERSLVQHVGAQRLQHRQRPGQGDRARR